MRENDDDDNTCEDVVAGEKKTINPELWQACAGPLVNLPAAGTHVVYFPQGHSEQVCLPTRGVHPGICRVLSMISWSGLILFIVCM